MALRTMEDLSVEGHVEDAEHQLNRALDRGDEAALAVWARRWGRSALERARDAETVDSEKDEVSRFNADDITGVERDITKALESLEVVTKYFEIEKPSKLEFDQASDAVEKAIELINDIDLAGIEL